MTTVTAPQGFEGCRFYDDGTREWRAAFRRQGDTYWTNAYLPVGHAHLIEADLDSRAEHAIRHAIDIRGLRR